jgi:hypothetical protein
VNIGVGTSDVYQFHIIQNNRITLFSVGSVGIVAMLTFLLVSPTVASAFASLLTAMSNRALAQNEDGVIILEGATVIDGTGDLPKINTTIIINGSRIASLSSNTINNYDFSSQKCH